MAGYIKILNRKIGPGEKVFIIAEAGVNHNGSLKTAMKIIDCAARSGADAVKFQTFRTEELVTRKAPKAGYQNRTVPGKSQFEMLKALELTEDDFRRLYDYCRRRKIMFLSTPFDIESARFLNRLGMAAFKISSGEITNIPLLKEVARYGKSIILSTGMSTMGEVKKAVNAICSKRACRLALLHCTSNYPTKISDVNLSAMLTLKDVFGVPTGYSDHTEGIEVAIAAAALGACIIEKHVTLDKNMKGPDHKASLDMREFKDMVGCIRRVEAAFGDGVKAPVNSELSVKKVIRKSIVAMSDLRAGARISRGDIGVKRPGIGISPEYVDDIAGALVIKPIRKDELIAWEKIKR